MSGKVAAALEVVAVMRPPKARGRHIATCLAGSLNYEEAVAAFGAAGVAGPVADLGTLALECLRGDRGATADLTVAEPTPADVWSILFAAAADGGAHNTGEGAAYGRLYAWRSLDALCGASEFDTVDHIARLVADARWFTFAA